MLTPKADATTLRLDVFASFNSWPSADQVLVKLLFRIGARLHELYVIHQAAWMANPPPNAVYVAPTANEMDDITDGNDPAMKACIDAISAVMLARYAKDKCTNNAQKDAARHAEIQHVSSMLLSSLLEACSSDARFCHLKELKYIVEDKLAYNVITVEMATNLWSLPGVRLLWDVIDTVNKQKLTANTSAGALFEPPDVYSSIHQHKDKIGPALRALNDAKLASAAALLDHLEVISLANFVTTCSWPTPHTTPFFLPPEFPVLLRHNSTPLWEPDPALARRPRQQQAGTGHGRPERAPGRRRRAVTPPAQRDCVKAVL
jgi:hypothetical protein